VFQVVITNGEQLLLVLQSVTVCITMVAINTYAQLFLVGQ